MSAGLVQVITGVALFTISVAGFEVAEPQELVITIS